MQKKIAVLAGDGIGEEIMAQALGVLDAVAKKYNHSFSLEKALVGAVAIDKTGDPLPAETLELCRNSDAILFGCIGDPRFDNDPSAQVRPEQGLLRLRKSLNLFTNIRPIKVYDSLAELSPLKTKNITGVDYVIYRELTSGIYFGEKYTSPEGDEASDTMYYHKDEILRIARKAYAAAQKRKKKLTLVDKANVLDSSRLWRNVIQELSKEYPDVQTDYLFVDNAAMQIILNPGQFDVMLTGNMFGDILSDASSVIPGSLGLLPSASHGDVVPMYEPVHGSYPQAKGKDIANPTAMILCVAMMLDDFGLTQEAEDIRTRVGKLIESGRVTVDLSKDNPLSCSEFGGLVAEGV